MEAILVVLNWYFELVYLYIYIINPFLPNKNKYFFLHIILLLAGLLSYIPVIYIHYTIYTYIVVAPLYMIYMYIQDVYYSL